MTPLQSPVRIWLLILLMAALVGAFVVRCVPAEAENNQVAITIKDWGAGMKPAVTPYANDPTRIVWSQNFYSTYPGGRQLRVGVSRFGDTVTANDSQVMSLVFFSPKSDSGSVVYTAGGKWFGNVAGRRGFIFGPNFDWKASLTASRQVRPFAGGDSLVVRGDSVVGFGSVFTRDVQPGDTISDTLGQAKKVKYIKSDEKLYIDGTWSAPDTLYKYLLSRSYPTGGYRPFLLQSGDNLYTGTVQSSPQVIYSLRDTLRVRHLGVVDSFYIDSVYSKYPPTVPAWDSTAKYGLRRSWDTLPLADSARFIKEFQLVSRRKAGEWNTDQWVSNASGNPQAYYVRVGFESKDVFFQIRGNTDTSIYLASWYVDTTTVSGGAAAIGSDTSWNGDVYNHWGTTLKDTLTATQVEGKWGYVYCAVGYSEVAVHDSSTGTVNVAGRGALFWTVDATPPIDSTAFYKYLHFIHLTGNDVDFLAYSNSMSRTIGEREVYSEKEITTWPKGDTAVEQATAYYCGCGLGKDWTLDLEEVTEECRSCLSPGVVQGFYYKVKTTRTDIATVEAKSVADSYFPIRFMRKKGDTLIFVTSISLALNDPVLEQTKNWEITRIAMPNWSGMAEWQTPPQLVAWGDTSSPSLLSFSEIGNQWDWSVLRDVLVGDNPATPVVSCVGYDDQLIAFKPRTMLAFDGSRFTEISQSDGLVGQRAAVGLTKELYWLDVDGMKKMQRRDLSGYSIVNVSKDIDPVMNSWSSQQFGTDLVPSVLNAAKKGLSIMTWNQRDNHLYLFAAFGSATKPNGCLTYDLGRGVWDGYLTIKANDAVWAKVRDTSRILIACQDSASIFALDYAYTDLGQGIDGYVSSAPFYLTSEGGDPVYSVPQRVWFTSRSYANSLDSAYLVLIGDGKSDTLDLSYSASLGDSKQIFRLSGDNVSLFWRYELRVYGKDTYANTFQPYELTMFFEPLGADF